MTQSQITSATDAIGNSDPSSTAGIPSSNFVANVTAAMFFVILIATIVTVMSIAVIIKFYM